MYPIICRFAFINIYAYGVMLAVAWIISTWLAERLAYAEALPRGLINDLALLVFIFGIIGARFLYVLLHWQFYLHHPLEIIMLHHGGLSWFGGLIFGLGAGIVYLNVKRQDIWRVLDIVAPFVALGQAIGRIGCLLNGCCYGRPSAWGLYFPVHEQILIPTQIYSSLSLLFIFVLLRFYQTTAHQKGKVFILYLILYSLKRFFMEFWRGDVYVIWAGLSLFQIFSLVILIFSILIFFSLNKK